MIYGDTIETSTFYATGAWVWGGLINSPGSVGIDKIIPMPPNGWMISGDFAGYLVEYHDRGGGNGQCVSIADVFDGVIDYTDGDPANTLTGTILYSVIDLQ